MWLALFHKLESQNSLKEKMNLAQEFLVLLWLGPATSCSCRHEFPAIMISVSLSCEPKYSPSFDIAFVGYFVIVKRKVIKYSLYWEETEGLLWPATVLWPGSSGQSQAHVTEDSQGLSQPRAWSDLNSRHLVLQIQWCVRGKHEKELRVFAFFNMGKAKVGDCRKEVFSDAEEFALTAGIKPYGKGMMRHPSG